MTQGNIERYHRSLKNRILLENSYLPGQLEARLAEFVEFYNNRRYHESLGNLTPADNLLWASDEVAPDNDYSRRCRGRGWRGQRLRFGPGAW
jgi:transposase InsO family protein